MRWQGYRRCSTLSSNLKPNLRQLTLLLVALLPPPPLVLPGLLLGLALRGFEIQIQMVGAVY